MEFTRERVPHGYNLSSNRIPTTKCMPRGISSRYFCREMLQATARKLRIISVIGRLSHDDFRWKIIASPTFNQTIQIIFSRKETIQITKQKTKTKTNKQTKNNTKSKYKQKHKTKCNMIKMDIKSLYAKQNKDYKDILWLVTDSIIKKSK